MSDIVVVERGPTEAEKNMIARKLLSRCLYRVSWNTCKKHEGGIILPDGAFDQDVEEAAKSLKALGGSWEEWT